MKIKVNWTNFVLLLMLLSWHVIGTFHFGGNWLPSSDAEVIMDGMAVLGLILLCKDNN